MSDHEEQIHTEERLPTAPSHDENGFIFVPPTPQSSIDIGNDKQPESGVELSDINKLLIDLSNSTSTTSPSTDFHGLSKTISAADSSTGDEPSEEPLKPTQPSKITSSTFSPSKESPKESTKESGKECSVCPYYMLGKI
jgi:hypothetical protein